MKTLLTQRRTWSWLWKEEASIQTLEPPPAPSVPLTSLAIIAFAEEGEEEEAWPARGEEEVEKVQGVMWMWRRKRMRMGRKERGERRRTETHLYPYLLCWAWLLCCPTARSWTAEWAGPTTAPATRSRLNTTCWVIRPVPVTPTPPTHQAAPGSSDRDPAPGKTGDLKADINAKSVICWVLESYSAQFSSWQLRNILTSSNWLQPWGQ